MSRVKSLEIRGQAERHSDAMALVPKAGDAAMVVRERLRSIAIRCPDGCGEVISVNLDPRSGPAWKMYQQDGALTIYPSVWKESGCRAHFIVWRNRLLWCDTYDSPHWKDDNVKQRVQRQLPASGTAHAHFEELAAKLGLIPWEVLWACHSLVSEKIAVASEKATRFGLASPTKTPQRLDRMS